MPIPALRLLTRRCVGGSIPRGACVPQDPKDLQHTIAERNVLALVNTSEHPFLLGLRFAFHTPAKLYYVLNFCNGGDLYFLLSRCKKFKEGQARFYAGEVFCALQVIASRLNEPQ